MKKMTREQFRLYRENLILRNLEGAMTANQVIDKIFKSDLRRGTGAMLLRGWKFYVHLNKFFAKMERDEKIKHVGIYDTGEKLWMKL